MSIEDQLSRTIALLSVDFDISDRNAILRALTNTRVAIVASESVTNSLAGQTAIATAAMLMARSGHQVFVDIPNALLIGNQPPLSGTWFQQAISDVGGKLIDGVPIVLGSPPVGVDVTFYLGVDQPWAISNSRRNISVGASDWAAGFCEMPLKRSWSATTWPMGALAAAVLMAAEAIKISVRMLLPLSPRGSDIRVFFEELPKAGLTLAPPDTPLITDIGSIDIISAGAISNAFLYSVLRVPDIVGQARTFDRDSSDGGNLNRNAFLTTDWVGKPKVALFANHATPRFTIDPIPEHFPLDGSVSLAESVIVGVDDVPARWALASMAAAWMGVGATTHFNSMASYHYRHSACAACLHATDEEIDGPTPTIAFVSFLAGLLVAADLMIETGSRNVSTASRQRYMSALRPDGLWANIVPPNPDCPARCPLSTMRAV